MKKVWPIIAVLAIIAVIIVILVINKNRSSEQTQIASEASASVTVGIIEVTEEPFNRSFISNGSLEPFRELSFVSDVSGRVLEVFADEGTVVSKGKILVQVDDEMLKADFAASEAAYNALKTDLERFTNANMSGGVTDQQLETIRTQFAAAESRYISSKRRLEDARIKSPISGTVVKRYVEVGTYLNPGARLFDIMDDSRLRAVCNVTERQVMLLKEGQNVTISCNVFPGEKYIGEITFVGSKADRSLNYPVEITISGSEKKNLKAGMYVTAYFDIESENKVIMIPRSAITGSVKNAKVFTVTNGKAAEKEVTVGSMIGNKVEILDGLQAGDSIIVAGLINVSDGVMVRNKTDR
ncbi:MAG: efflux RND transporter periplasmic adaptor subunit [Bacteroidales bacterium]|nr:efflux RND transporter periplasmic adaptor subunit [Bacteroidales bacterium]